MTASIWAPNGFSPEVVPFTTFEFVSTSGQTTYSIDPYTAVHKSQLQVFRGGTSSTRGQLLKNSEFSISGTSIVLVSPAGASEFVRVDVYMEIPASGGDVFPPLEADKFLFTDGTTVSWETVAVPDLLPPLEAGKFLTNDGTTLDWQSIASSVVSPKQFGAIGDGVADDTTALRAAIAGVPEGTQLIFDGLFKITDTLIWDRHVLPTCLNTNCGIVVAVGSAKNGIEFLGTSAGTLLGLNNLETSLNVYGQANCCVTGVVMQRVDRSNIKLNIRLGATAYGIRARGCLINNWNIQSSANYTPPGLPFTPGMQLNHLAVENYGVPSSTFTSVTVSGPASPGVVSWVAHGKVANTPVVFGGTGTPPAPFTPGKPYFIVNPLTDSFQLSEVRGGTAIATTGAGTVAQLATCYPIASNTNNFLVNFEGGTQGYIQSPMPGEGANTLTGEIEGLLGTPAYVEDCLGFHFKDLRMEANGVDITVKGALQLKVGGTVTFLGGLKPDGLTYYANTINLQTCRSYGIDGYYGKLNIDSSCQGGTLGPSMAPDQYSLVNSDTSLIQTAASVISLTSDTMAGGPGHPTMETLFVNPFLDIYNVNSPTVGPPLNVAMTSYSAGDIVLETGTTYPRSPSSTSAKCLSRGTVIPNGMIVTPGIQPWKSDEWVSVLVPIRMISAAYTAIVYVYDGVKFKEIGRTKSSGVWEDIRGSCQLVAGNSWSICIDVMNAAMTVRSGGVQYYVGGVNVVKGAIPPATISNSHARMNYVSSSISQTPWRQGALAVSGGLAYMAVGNASSADWKQIS